jgi:hypothetical protein
MLEGSIKMWLREKGLGSMDWILVAQVKGQWKDVVSKGNEPICYIKC